jgi:hypothetical protein
MEEQNINTQPQATPSAQPQTSVPGAIVAFVFGIISVSTFWLTFYFIVPGLIPLIFGIIAMLRGKKAEKIYAENPANYVKAHGAFAKTGKILGTIGWIITAVIMAIIITIIILIAAGVAFHNPFGNICFN